MRLRLAVAVGYRFTDGKVLQRFKPQQCRCIRYFCFVFIKQLVALRRGKALFQGRVDRGMEGLFSVENQSTLFIKQDVFITLQLALQLADGLGVAYDEICFLIIRLRFDRNIVSIALPLFECEIVLAVLVLICSRNRQFENTFLLDEIGNAVIPVSRRICRLNEIVFSNRKLTEIDEPLRNRRPVYSLAAVFSIGGYHGVRHGIFRAVAGPARIHGVAIRHLFALIVLHRRIDRILHPRQRGTRAVHIHEERLIVVSHVDNTGVRAGKAFAEVRLSVRGKREDAVILCGVGGILGDKRRGIRYVKRAVPFPKVFVVVIWA